MEKRNNDFKLDFMPIGQAIKKARVAKGMTREQLGNILDYEPRHLQAIENEGQYPSLELSVVEATAFLPILNRQERRSHRWSCFQPYIDFACKRRQSYPPRCK